MPGARFAPYHVRRVSALVQGYHPVHEIDVFSRLRCVDGGNANGGRAETVAKAEARPFGARPVKVGEGTANLFRTRYHLIEAAVAIFTAENPKTLSCSFSGLRTLECAASVDSLSATIDASVARGWRSMAQEAAVPTCPGDGRCERLQITNSAGRLRIGGHAAITWRSWLELPWLNRPARVTNWNLAIAIALNLRS
jgi:hypothetical protein